MPLRPFFALLLSGPLLLADGLADLKAALQAQPVPTKIRVKVESENLARESGKDTVERRTALVEDGPEGTTVLEDSQKAAGAQVPEALKKGSTHPGGRKGRGAYHDELRPTENLLEQLKTARLLEEKTEAYEGRPARRLKLALDLDLDAETREHLKRAEHEATVWIGADGLPLAVTHRIEIKTRVLLLASVWTKIDIRLRFQRAQDRLLVLDEQADVQGSALGKPFSGKETTRCSLVP
jgi:hypothetical protein